MNTLPYAIRELKRRKYRTILSIIGIIIAVSTLITLVMAARGWKTCTAVPLNSIGTDIIFIYTAPIEPKGSGCYVANHLFSYPFKQTLLEEIENIPNVENAVPLLMHRLRALVFTGIEPSETETNAVLEDSIIEGRYLRTNDSYVAIVDKEYAEFNNLTLGSKVNYVIDFEVVGLVEVSATNIMKSHIYVNLPIVQEVLPEKPIGLVNLALIRTSSPDLVKQTAISIEEKWPNSTTLTSSDLAKTASGIIQINEETAWSISVVITIITILFVAKSQLANVTERTKEIGILKAIGWSNKNISNQIVIESLLQGIVGGIIGCFFGYLFALYVLITIGGEIGGALSFVTIDPTLLILGFGIAVVSAVIAGLFSSLRAARLIPAEALKTI